METIQRVIPRNELLERMLERGCRDRAAERVTIDRAAMDQEYHKYRNERRQSYINSYRLHLHAGAKRDVLRGE